MKFCKFSLGVGKRSSNLAVTGELGRYPLFIEIIISMFWGQFCTLTPLPL
jgi:hypothetical protein